MLSFAFVACGEQASDAANSGSEPAATHGDVLARTGAEADSPDPGGGQIGLTIAWRIGVDNGAEAFTFARVRSGAIDDRGRSYVLDAGSSVLRVFDSGGSHIMSVGGRGKGPGEFMQPRTVRVAFGAVWVVDSQNGLLRFEWHADTLRFQARVELPFVATDYCALGSEAIVYGVFGDSVLHRLSPNGRLMGSFGPMEGPNDGSPDGMFTRRGVNRYGRIACSAETNRVAVVIDQFPTIRLFDSATGALAAVDSMADYVPRFLILQGNGYTSLEGEQGADRFVTATDWDGSSFLLQSLRVTPDSSEVLSTCTLNVGQVGCVRVAGSLGTVLAARDSMVLSVVESPYPIVSLMKRARPTR